MTTHLAQPPAIDLAALTDGLRADTLARVATALNRHLVLSFPAELPADLKDAVQSRVKRQRR